MQTSLNQNWNSIQLHFIGLVAKDSEVDISKATCIMLKVSAWLDTTWAVETSVLLKFGWANPLNWHMLLVSLHCMKCLACKISLCHFWRLQYGHCIVQGDTVYFTGRITAVWLSQGIDFNFYALFVLLAPGCVMEIDDGIKMHQPYSNPCYYGF